MTVLANRHAVFTSTTHKLIFRWSGKCVCVLCSVSRPKKERGWGSHRSSWRALSFRVAFHLHHLCRGLVTLEVDSCHVDGIFFFLFLMKLVLAGFKQIIAAVSWLQTKHLSDIISCLSTVAEVGQVAFCLPFWVVSDKPGCSSIYLQWCLYKTCCLLSD